MMNDQHKPAEQDEPADEPLPPSSDEEDIADLNRIIRSRTATPKGKVAAYHQRGHKHYLNGDYDRAMRDFRKALKLDKTYSEAYAGRGDVYLLKEKYDRAIQEYTKAINLDKTNAEYYELRGTARHQKGAYAAAKRDYSRAIALDGSYVKSFHSRGMLHLEKGDYRQAVEDFTAAIDLETDDAETYLQRGIACVLSGDQAASRQIFADLLQADQVSQGELRLSNAYCHVAHQLSALAGQLGLATELVHELNFCFGELIAGIEALKSRLQFRFESPSMLGHYASLDTLAALVSGDVFRLYNSDYMNDVKEGNAFFEVMARYGVDVPGLFYNMGGGGGGRGDGDASGSGRGDGSRGDGGGRISPAYIGSFVRVDTASEADLNDYLDGRLVLWCMYGKHDGQDAAGACLLFDERQFEKDDVQLKIGGMPNAPGSAAVAAAAATGTDREAAPAGEAGEAGTAATAGETGTAKLAKLAANVELPEAYQVVYLSQAKQFEPELQDIAQALQALAAAITRHSRPLGKPAQQQLFELAGKTLDSIRFLFKTDHYRDEREVRIVKLSYHTEDEAAVGAVAGAAVGAVAGAAVGAVAGAAVGAGRTPVAGAAPVAAKPPEHAVEPAGAVPQFYMGLPDLGFQEIILGPKAGWLSEWKRRLKDNSRNSGIRRSEIPFG